MEVTCRNPGSLALVVALVLLGSSAPASAQDEAQRVTVLSVTESGEATGLGDALHGAVRAQIEFHRGFTLDSVPSQSLDDLLLAVGCGTLDECADLLREIMETDLIAWGHVDVSEGTVSVQLTLWNLQTGMEIRRRSHVLGGVSPLFVREHRAVFARALLYGDEARMTVASFPEGATVEIDGEVVGTTPATLDGLSLGPHVVRVSEPGYAAREEVVVADLEEGLVNVVLRSERDVGRATREPREPMNTGFLPWALIAAGSGMVAGGVVSGVQETQTQREFDDVVAERDLDRERAETLRDDGERQARLANALTAAGAVTIVAGVVWKVLSPAADDDSSSSASRPVTLTPVVAPLVRGAEIGVSF